MKFKMSKRYAYITQGFGIIIINNSKSGFRCTIEAARNLDKSSSGLDVVSVEIDQKIIWVSLKEFKENKLIEKEIPRNLFDGEK